MPFTPVLAISIPSRYNFIDDPSNTIAVWYQTPVSRKPVFARKVTVFLPLTFTRACSTVSSVEPREVVFKLNTCELLLMFRVFEIIRGLRLAPGKESALTHAASVKPDPSTSNGPRFTLPDPSNNSDDTEPSPDSKS